MNLVKIMEKERVTSAEHAGIIKTLLRILHNVTPGQHAVKSGNVSWGKWVEYKYTIDGGITISAYAYDGTLYKASELALLQLIEKVQDHVYYNQLVG